MNTMTSKITGGLFAQPFVQVQIKENIKAALHQPLWGESPSDQWIPLTKDHVFKLQFTMHHPRP